MSDYTTEYQLGNFTAVQYLDIQEPMTPSGNTSLGGIVNALNTYYKSSSFAYYQPITSNNRTTYQATLSSTGLQIPFAQLESFNDGCPTGFTAPYYIEGNELDYDLMLGNINQLTFMLSADPYLQADYPGEYNDYEYNYDLFYDYTQKYTTNATMLGLKPEIYYYSKVAFAWGAFASTMIIIMFILPSFWGYWELGRKVTLGPLEIANAFEAPAFAHVDRGTGHVDHVIDAVGQTRVKYDTNGKYGFVHH